ncbi:MAG: hypothetical protein AAB884_01860 [Patescibacteria group bacterium]
MTKKRKVDSFYKPLSVESIHLSEFLRLALKSLVMLVDPQNNTVFITDDPTIFNPAMKKLRDKYARYFPVLKNSPFSQKGVIPTSKEWYEAIQLLIMSGALVPLRMCRAIRWFEDSERVTNENLRKLFSKNKELRPIFDKFVSDLKCLVVRSPITGRHPSVFKPIKQARK